MKTFWALTLLGGMCEWVVVALAYLSLCDRSWSEFRVMLMT